MSYRNARNISLKSFLSSQFLLVSLIPVIVVSVLAGIFLLPHLSSQETLEQEALAQAITARIEGRFESAKRELRRFSEFLPFLDSDTDIQQLLDNVAASNAVYEAIYITDQDGMVTQVGLPELYQPLRGNYIGLDMSRKKFFLDARHQQQERYYGTFLSAVSGRLSTGYLIPMGDQTLIAEISIGELPELSQFLSKESKQKIMILDRDGQLLVHPDSSLDNQQLNLSNIPLVKEGIKQGGASGPFSFQGTEYFGSLILTDKSGWVVIVSKTLASYRSTIITSGLILLVALLIGMLVAIIVAGIVGGVFSRRFKVYMQLAEAITSGHYDVQPIPSKIKEIESLGREILHAGQQIKNRELALAAKEQRYRALVEQSPVAVIEWDEHLEVIRWNRVAQNILGFLDKGSVSSAIDYLAQEENQQQLAALSERFKTESSFIGEHQFKSETGNIIMCRSFNASIADDNGELIGYLSLVEDITEQCRIEGELQDLNTRLEQRVADRTTALSNTNEQLKHALKNLKRTQSELLRADKLAALGAMVAGVSHELNTPIGNALMAITTLEEQTRMFEEEYRAGRVKRTMFERYLETTKESEQLVTKNLNRAAELIISFKQVAVDQTSAQKRKFELKQHLEEVLMTLKPLIKKSAVILESEIPEGIELESFPGSLSQVVTNLINNALLHGFEAKASGTVLVSAQEVSGERVKISIKDTGKGIAKEHLDKVFDPFFTTRLGEGGTGLGLHIVHNIVTGVLGGTIELSSDDKGTEFVIEIPFKV
ncbi:ATP-binding protein [Alkalimarinus coralli]|uniref:ATP-binding protein n=1 Tax=Alkalimarinus coralli TaxID=2935863 RepID=UPI00202B8AB2|nr:ATP-binding protein [Alkalimarinus coralli]